MTEPKPLSVTQAMNAAKRTLESVSVTVVGEISEFNDKPGYKAAYFTISDEGASMPCLMWRDVYRASGVELRPGLLVEINGCFTAYVPKGRMQFSVRSMRLAGEGDLRLKVAQLARKLELEGLMDPRRKRPLPPIPECIAVVTSPRGKAVHDVLRTLRRRYPLAELLVAGVPVEGEAAPLAICKGLLAAEAAEPDVILLVRGGGSYEDLMPFNDERVARAVASCSIPVVTGIGHEPDNSIADMVSDMRCSTPTAAAEAVAPSIDEISARLDAVQMRLGNALVSKADGIRHRLELLTKRPVFTDPMAVLGPFYQTIDLTGSRLSRAIPEALARDGQKLDYLRDRMVRVAPSMFGRQERQVGLAAARLHDLSPLSILSRGYAVVYGDDGLRVIDSVEETAVGENLNVRVNDGEINCTVNATRYAAPAAEMEA